jgi:hypothetical protein
MSLNKPLFSGFSRAWAIVAVVVCSIAFGAVAWKRLPLGIPPSQPSRIEQQPYGEESGAELRESWQATRRRESARYSDAELQQMVDRLFVQADPDRANFDGLLFAGSRPLPFLLKALDDPRTTTAVFSGSDIYGLGASPFERICNLLWSLRPAEAVAPLARYLDHRNPMFRRKAAWLLASIGTRECLKPVKKALADKDDEVRESALIGLTRAEKGRPRDKQFLAGVFPALIPLLNGGVYRPESPAGAMMAVAPAKAIPILESPRYFSVRNRQLAKVLEALDRPGVKVPKGILLPLLSKLESVATRESPAQVTYAATLALYANNPDAHAEAKFLSLIDSPSSILSSAAAQGLETLAGINVRNVVMDIYDRHGFTAMTQPQQFCFAVELYRDEVDNGGHNQYFYNDDGDLYEVAVQGLSAMGATPQAEILSDAARAFAPVPPPSTEEARRHLMEGFGASQDLILSKADQRFYQLESEPGKRLDVLMTFYALKHRNDFALALSSDAEQAEAGNR